MHVRDHAQHVWQPTVFDLILEIEDGDGGEVVGLTAAHLR